MKLKLTLPLFMLLGIFLASCSKKTNVPVPADAAFMMHLDGKSLNSKLSWDEIRQSDWFRLASEKATDSLSKAVLNDPATTGIDIQNDFYIFVKLRGKGGYSAVVGNISDETKFANFVATSMKDKKAVKEGSLNVVRDGKNVLTWKGKRFVFITDSPDVNTSGAFTGNNTDPSTRAFVTDSLVKFASEVYDIKGKASIGNDSRFSKVMSENADAHFWMNSSELYGGALPSILAMTKMGLLLEDNSMGASLNFEDGKVAINGKNFFNKELEKLYEKYPMKNIDESILKKIPAGEVDAAVIMNYPPEGLKAFVTLLGVDGILNLLLAETGFTIDDFVKANKGDLLFSVSNFTMGPKVKTYVMDGKEQSYTTTEPDAKFLFAASVNDKPKFEKFISVLSEKFNKQFGQEGAMSRPLFPYLLKDDWFLAGNDSAYLNQWAVTSTAHPFIDKIKGHPMGGFADIQKFISGSMASFNKDSLHVDTMGRRIAEESLKVWQDVVFWGGEFKNKSTTFSFEVNMVDKKTNSLKQLNSYFSILAKMMDEKEKRQKLENPPMPQDTLITAPVPVPGN